MSGRSVARYGGVSIGNMRIQNMMVKALSCGVGVAILVGSSSLRAYGYNDHDDPNCRGDSQSPNQAVTINTDQTAKAVRARTSSTPGAITAQPGDAVPSSHPHRVRLSWNASTPASKAPADAIKGYDLYRRESGKGYEKISPALIQGTRCIDYLVKAGQTYYYEAKAVSSSGTASKSSAPIKVKVPSR